NSAGSSPATAAVTADVQIPLQTADITIGPGANKSAMFTSSTGALTTFKFAGHGTATVHFAGTTVSQGSNKAGIVVSGTNVLVTGISTSGTDASSALTILTKGGGNTVSIGGITTGGPMKSITAITASLVGKLAVAGGISKIALGSAAAATIDVNGVLGTLRIPSINGVAVTTGGAIRSIVSTVWTSSQPIN